MSAYSPILAVGEEPPPLHPQEEDCPHETGRPPPRRKAGRLRRKAAGRFQVLNSFVDHTLGSLNRSEAVAWLVLYRDSRDGVARTSLADLARRGGMDRRTACRAVHRLRARGLVELLHRGGLNWGPSTYRVHGTPKDG